MDMDMGMTFLAFQAHSPLAYNFFGSPQPIALQTSSFKLQGVAALALRRTFECTSMRTVPHHGAYAMCILQDKLQLQY